MAKTLFAYHKTNEFGAFNGDIYYTNKDTTCEGDLLYVISGDDANGGGKDYSLEGLFKIYRIANGLYYRENSTGEKTGFKYKLQLQSVRVPDKPIPLMTAGWYSRDEVHRYFSSGQNFNPLPTAPNYKERFDILLSGFGQGNSIELAEDLAEIERKVSDVTERERLTKARIGQGRFRSDVTEIWGIGEVCPLTGIDVPELLIASHIKPWRDSDNSEKLDPTNGILLAAHVDKLFDRYLLSFKSDRGVFKVDIHPRVRTAMSTLNITVGKELKTTYLRLSDTGRFGDYLEQHYAKFQERVRKNEPTSF